MSDYRQPYFVIFMVALIFRLCLMVFVPYPFSPLPVYKNFVADDQFHYDILGWNLARGNGFSESSSQPFEPSIARPPVYPLFLAGVYFIFGHNHKNVLVAQSILDSLTAVLISLLSLKLFKNKTIAFLAGTLVALCPFTAFFTRILISETLAVFLTTVSMGAIMYAFENPKKKYYFLSGVAMGLLILTKPVFFVFPLFACILKLKLNFSRKQIVNLLTYFIAIFLCILPWTIRNYCHFKTIIPFQTGAGSKLWLSTVYPYKAIKKIPDDFSPEENAKFFKFLTLTDNQRIEYDKELKRIAISRIRKAPFKYIFYNLIRIPRLWISSYSHYISIEEHLLSIKEKAKIFTKIMLFFINISYLITYIIGSILLLKKWRLLFPIFLFFVYITFVHIFIGGYEPRYIIPAWPLLVIFSSYAIVEISKYKNT